MPTAPAVCLGVVLCSLMVDSTVCKQMTVSLFKEPCILVVLDLYVTYLIKLVFLAGVWSCQLEFSVTCKKSRHNTPVGMYIHFAILILHIPPPLPPHTTFQSTALSSPSHSARALTHATRYAPLVSLGTTPSKQSTMTAEYSGSWRFRVCKVPSSFLKTSATECLSWSYRIT